MSYDNNPEVIAQVECVRNDEAYTHPDVICGVQVVAGEKRYPGGRISLDLRSVVKQQNLVLSFDAEELMAALARAMVNRTGKST